MLIISLLLIGLIAATLITEESVVAEQEELIAIPVKSEERQ